MQDRQTTPRMTEQDTNTLSAANYYFIDPKDEFDPVQPSLRDDVIRLYNIQDLAQALTRTNPNGTKGIKLRKSYKSHISDLPGKHTIPTEDQSFTHIALMPENPDFTKPEIAPFDLQYLEKVMNMEKTGPNGIPGFDSSQLALSGMDTSELKREKKRKAVSAAVSPEQQPDTKRRHVQVKFT